MSPGPGAIEREADSPQEAALRLDGRLAGRGSAVRKPERVVSLYRLSQRLVVPFDGVPAGSLGIVEGLVTAT